MEREGPQQTNLRKTPEPEPRGRPGSLGEVFRERTQPNRPDARTSVVNPSRTRRNGARVAPLGPDDPQAKPGQKGP